MHLIRTIALFSFTTSRPASLIHWKVTSRQLAAGCAVIVIAGCAGPSAGASRTSARLTAYTIPTADSRPVGIVAGPDGAMWFIETLGNKVGKLSTAHVVTEYTIPTEGAYGPMSVDGITPQFKPAGITVGSDGSLWFTEYAANKVAKLTSLGSFTEYPIPSDNAYPDGIVAGPDGNIWLTESGTDKVAKVTPRGTITEYPLARIPYSIAASADGNIWVGEGGGLAKITPGGLVTNYPFAGSAGAIVAGPDGNMWFADWNGSPAIGKVTAFGKITRYSIPEDHIPVAYPGFITTASDGALWFTMDGFGAFVGRVSTTGDFTELTLPGFPYSGGYDSGGIAAGPDGNVWFTSVLSDELIKVDARSQPGTADAWPGF